MFNSFSRPPKAARVVGPGAPEVTGTSPDWLASINAIITQQQQPIWNTLSLQMAQNRQMQQTVLDLPKMLLDQKQVPVKASATQPSQAAHIADASPSPPHGAEAGAPLVDYEDGDSLSDGEGMSLHSHSADQDFETFSQYSDAGKPLTLVERLEKLYARLPDLTPPPPPSQQMVPSVREIPEIENRPRSLPAPPLILATFQRFRSQYRRQEGSSPLVDEVTGAVIAQEDDSDCSSKKKALTQPTKKSPLQFQVHGAAHAVNSKLDMNYLKLFPDHCSKNFRLSYGQMNMLQTAASYSLDACCHVDALLLGVKKCIEATLENLSDYEYESEEEETAMTSDLHEALEYLQSLSFAEDFIIKKNVWLFSSIAAFMRESMLSAVPHLDPELSAWLRNLPFNAGKLYNKYDIMIIYMKYI